jgi:hypothetical protein
MPLWFMLAGTEPEELRKSFSDFFSAHNFPKGVALWKWKNSYWICSPSKNKQEILASFTSFRVIEFSSAPSPTDIEFVGGDRNAIEVKK